MQRLTGHAAMRSTNRVIRGLLVLLAATVIVVSGGLLIVHVRGVRLLSIQTDSMIPTFAAGDALIVEPVSAKQLHIGDIISYQSSANPAVTISHRLIAINQNTGWLTTAGDARASPDLPFPPQQIVGRATAKAPRLGKLLDILHHPLGLAIAVYLPAATIIGAEVLRLVRKYARPTYLLDYSYETKRSKA